MNPKPTALIMSDDATATENVPVQVEHSLAAAEPDVDDDAVILEALPGSGLGDELEHPLCLVRRELGDIAERLDVPLGEHEEMGRRLRRDVADRNEPVGSVDMVALPDEPAEEAVLRRQRRAPPRRRHPRPGR